MASLTCSLRASHTEHEITVKVGPTYSDIDEPADVRALVQRLDAAVSGDGCVCPCAYTAARAALAYAEMHQQSSSTASSSKT